MEDEIIEQENEEENLSRALPILGRTVQIYSNDGSEILYTKLNITQTQYEVFENGITDYQQLEWGWEYSGEEIFLGFATSANATTPTLVNGDTGTLGFRGNTFYIVTRPAPETYKPIKVKYGENELATISEEKLTIKCGGKVMLGNIVIEKI